jgi:Asp-tRNA(Asn)/Glu-tRNA(Gln) amidotransferase A subunit family amidase
VVGYKPSYGRVPTDGLIYCAPSLDVIGLFTQDCAGMFLAASVLVPNFRPEPPRRLPRLGVPDGAFLLPVSGEPRRLFEAQLESLRWAGYEIENLLFYSREDLSDYHAQARDLLHGEMARVHEVWARDYASLYRPGTLRAIETGRAVPEARLEATRRGQEVLRGAIHSLMDEHGVDFLVCPSSNGPAPRGDRPTGTGAMTTIWSYAGLPVMSLPGAKTAAGMPVGLQLIGRFGRDEALVDAAQYIHRKLDEPNRRSPPALF